MAASAELTKTYGIMEDNKQHILEKLKVKMKINEFMRNREIGKIGKIGKINDVMDAFLELIPEHVISGHIPKELYNRNFDFEKSE